MSYLLQSLTHANDLKYMSAYFAVATSMWNCFVHCEKISLQPAHFVLTLGWQRLCQNIKDHSFHWINVLSAFRRCIFMFQQVLYIRFVCLIFWKSHLEVKKLFFFKVIYPYNDCIDKTSEMWMLCLVSELCPSFLLFYFKNYWCWKCEFSAWTIFL